MRQAALFLLASSSLAVSKYFSEGWTPGQAAKTAIPPGQTYAPPANPTNTPQPTEPSGGGFNALLTGGPIGSLLSSFGINMTEKLEEARIKEENKWDKRIPLIHDDNFNEVIVNEVLSLEEEAKRVWFLLITVTAAQKDGISQLFDNRFDEAYDMTVQAKDLDHVKWGRIDYMNVTRITTKWNVWRGPMLVVLADRGRTLRFLNARYVRPQPELIRRWLLEQSYLEQEPWSSAFGPGGKREFILDYAATFFQKWYDLSTSVPRWLFYIITAGFASVMLQLMHRTSKPKAKKTVPVVPSPVPATPLTTSQATATGSTTRSQAKKRK